MLATASQNALENLLNKDVLSVALDNKDEIESVSFGVDKGCEYKNDIYVSFACKTISNHGEVPCMCLDVLDQEKLKNISIDMKLAENIAHYVSGLLGGKRVYQG